MAKLIAFTAFLLVGIPLEQAAAGSAALRIFWSETIPGGRDTQDALAIRGISLDASGSIVALGNKGVSQSILLRPSEAGPGSIIELATQGQALQIVQGPAETLWLAGLTNRRMYVPGGTMADAYLGRLDPQGRIVAEYSFHSFRFRFIQSVTMLDSGELVVAGRDGAENWLAAVSTQGMLLWQRRLGLGKGVAVSAVGDQIVAATIAGRREDNNKKYWDNVDVRTVNRTGRVVGWQTIRTNINSHSGSGSGTVAMVKSRTAFYVLSSWYDLLSAKPLEITKLSLDGAISWRKELPRSVLQQANGTWTSCYQGQMVLENGDLLVVCSIEAQILVFRLDANNGDVTVMSVPLPECHEGRPAALFLTQRKNGAIWIFGSRPDSNVGKSCAWLGELSLP
ncbi:hypothetical protein D3C84_479740 [compost metagenome]